MKIPSYPESRDLEMGDKPLLDRIFTDLQPRISELTFAGLYLFRLAHAYRLSMIGDSVLVLGKSYDGYSYCLTPLCGNINHALSILFDGGWSIYGADELFLSTYLTDGNLILVEERDSFDYLYSREELALLPGNRFHKKKNRISYFTRRHQYQVAKYSAEHCSGCLELLNSWLNIARNKSNLSLNMEVSATSEALHNFALLGLEGIVITEDGTVTAFALGERLNRETAVCHFEKADPFKEGLSQLINREFATLLFTDCSYINREQDLGEAGLRNAKLSYHPVELIKKYRVSRTLS
ncbi:MAG: DUF2156 domain-containing protein [Geobacter sp.]|nr:DUF2156 domain-containing protein [Geobacter sp.]